MANTISPALRALCSRLIDYAGTFPPAGLPCGTAIENFAAYRQSEHAWMLRWLVVSAGDLERVPREFDGALSILSESDQPRAAVIEAKSIIHATRPVYCEVPITQLDAVKQAGCYAKIRTGGVTREAIPAIAAVADYIRACAERKLPFKATAGLHHPVRAEQALTYAPDSPRAVMHGFLNVFLAASFAWHGQRELEALIGETDPGAFRFDEKAHWRNWSLELAQVNDARANFAHAFGSCSFVEPIQDLEAIGLL